MAASSKAVSLISLPREDYLENKAFPDSLLPSLLSNIGRRIRALCLDRFYTVIFEDDVDKPRYIIGWCEVSLQKEI